MAKKKRQPKGAPKARQARSAAKPDPMPDLPDPRVVEGVMRRALHMPAGGDGESALAKAQDLIYQAWEAPDEDERVRLALAALEVSADCADAYVILAQEVPTRKEALELYLQAVHAGERALGPKVFTEDVGHFWGILDTRPYMRARFGLADTLWSTGRRDEAIAHLHEMLRLNPSDNQGVRYTLAGWLLNMDGFDALATLLDQYDQDGTAAWAYTRALLAFRQDGDTARSKQLLKAATKANKHVPDYLIGEKPVPREQPEYYSLGQESEAILYAASSLGGWRTTPGAIAWLRGEQPEAKSKKKPAKTSGRGPQPLVKKRLERLTQKFDVWQADFREFGPRVELRGELVRPWLLLIASRSSELIIGQSVMEEPPSAATLWDNLARILQKPLAGKPHRPTELQVSPDPFWSELKEDIEELGVRVVVTPDLDYVDFLFDKLSEHMAEDQPPGLLEMPGVRPEHVGAFYQAAAEFYRRAAWRKLGYETAIKVECDGFDSGPWFAVVMGQSGLTFGLALYDDLKILQRLWSSDQSDEENARETVALTVTFDNEVDLPDADLDAIEDYGWELGGADAYPSIFRKERGMSMRPPLAWELELMEACLRTIPDFIERHNLDDQSTHRVNVSVASRELELKLSWIDE